MVDVAQLVRVADCGSVGRGFEPHLPPKIKNRFSKEAGFLFGAHNASICVRKKEKWPSFEA
jgi:hypothetical protein